MNKESSLHIQIELEKYLLTVFYYESFSFFINRLEFIIKYFI